MILSPNYRSRTGCGRLLSWFPAQLAKIVILPIAFVVLLMRQHLTEINNTGSIVDHRDNAKLVATCVEDRMVVNLIG